MTSDGPSRDPNATIDTAGATLRDASLTDTVRAIDTGPVDTAAEWLDAAAAVDRYRKQTTLGQGGMGEVMLCKDRRIGRDVAMKVVRPGHGKSMGFGPRFLREARVQGQLEHPSIVPVYDIGINDGGEAFFTMRRVRGATLEDILGELRKRDPETLERYSRRKLLSAFCSVCLAVDFAHARGVIHRDLKPSNIMFGDFGEVYLLDWGIAKLKEGTDEGASVVPERETEKGAHTVEGELLGTPGYMSPEQVRGNIAVIDRRSDVYALGAILFEILTLEPLHARTTMQAILVSTVTGTDARPSVRVPDSEVPPELETVCVKATALDASDRYTSPREISDAIERYLDGDRDLERRRELARTHVALAEQAAERALAGGEGAMSDRSHALTELGRALAWEPGNAAAMHTLVRLISEPPREMPAETVGAVDDHRRRLHRMGSRIAGLAFMSWVLYAPFLLAAGIRSASLAWLSAILFSLAAAVSFVGSASDRYVAYTPWIALVISSAAVASTASLFGPAFVLPSVVAANALSFVAGGERNIRHAAIAFGCLAIAAPALCEWAGVLPSAYAFEHGVMSIVPQMIEFRPAPTRLFLVLSNLAVLLSSCAYINRFRSALDAAEQRMHLQAWQLRQIIPDQARLAVNASEAQRAEAKPHPWSTRGRARAREERAAAE